MQGGTTQALVALVLFIMLPGCSSTYELQGIIVDGDGTPISGASVYLRPYGSPALQTYERETLPEPGSYNASDTDGAFTAGWAGRPSVEFFVLVVVRDGFKDSECIASAGDKDLRIVLERATKPGNNKTAG